MEEEGDHVEVDVPVVNSKHEVRHLIEQLTRELEMLEKSNTLLRIELCCPESVDDPVYLEAIEENERSIKSRQVKLRELHHILLQLDPAYRAELLAAGHVVSALHNDDETTDVVVATAAIAGQPVVVRVAGVAEEMQEEETQDPSRLDENITGLYL